MNVVSKGEREEIGRLSKMRAPAADEGVTLSNLPRASRPGSTLDLLTGKGE